MRILRVHAALALLILGCASARLPEGEKPLRVMTFNLRLNLASDGPNAWPLRKEIVASMIRFHRADILGVQEALPDQLRDLDALLPQFSRFGVGRSTERSGEHSAIFYRKDRFDLLAEDTFWLSETPNVPGVKGWDAAYERIVTWGRMRDRQTGKVFFHFNTHFDHVGQVARRVRLFQSAVELVHHPRPLAEHRHADDADVVRTSGPRGVGIGECGEKERCGPRLTRPPAGDFETPVGTEHIARL